MTFRVVDLSQFTHLSSDLPLPSGQGVPRGATSQELDTGRILRYDYDNGVWYAVSGGSGAGSANGSNNPSTSVIPASSTTTLTSDSQTRDTLDSMRTSLNLIAVAMARLLDLSLDELTDLAEEGPSGN